MSMHTLLAMRYSHERSDERPSKRSNARQARTIASCTASSASAPGPACGSEAGELAAVGVEGLFEVTGEGRPTSAMSEEGGQA